MSCEDVKLLKDDDLTNLLTERGITDADIREVIHTAETGGAKLYQEVRTHCLAKKRLGKFTVYAEYQIEDDGYKLLNGYSHRVSLNEDQK
jgi:glutamate synthase (NADPH/NADH) small chain